MDTDMGLDMSTDPDGGSKCPYGPYGPYGPRGPYGPYRPHGPYGPSYYGPYGPYKCASLTLVTPGPYGGSAEQWQLLRGASESAPRGRDLAADADRLLLATLERLTDLDRIV